MKKIKLKVISILVIVFFFSCSNDSDNLEIAVEETQLTIEDQPIEVQREYTINNLKKIGTAIAMIAEDKSMRSMVYKMVDKRFDGDTNVLIEQMMDVKPEDKNMTMRAYAEDLGMIKQMEDGMNAFKGIDNENWYPQLYIPFFDETSSTRIDSDIPPIILYDGNEDIVNFPAYELDANNNLIESELMIDQSYAENNEVWIISINSRSNNNIEDFDLIPIDGGGGSGGGGSGGGGNNQPCVLRIDLLTVANACQYESFAGGRTDVEIIRFLDNATLSAPNIRILGNEKGEEVIQIRRNNFRGGQNAVVNADFTLVSNFQTNANQGLDGLYWVLFERDGFPSGKRTATVQSISGGRTATLEYRSSDSLYNVGREQFFSAPSFFVNNECVIYNTTR